MFAARLERALTQPIYVVGCDADSAQFAVQGASDSVYDVTLLPLPKCTCLDFTTRHIRCCKHIINVVVRAMQLPADILQEPFNPAYFETIVLHALRARQYQLLDDLSAHPDRVSVTPKLDEECAICFENFDEQQPNSWWTCRACGHRVHAQCWRRWKHRSHTCPFCRADQ